jgi:hypothetical protein
MPPFTSLGLQFEQRDGIDPACRFAQDKPTGVIAPISTILSNAALTSSSAAVLPAPRLARHSARMRAEPMIFRS